ncbi:S-adenosyl-L-methionine dependent methyltransferase [Cyberlindnera jadinii NRRL Y-1542]|uniref:S-adenosyl-L-methionine dependent methyltransferase n=1 Tax=Cyberlindnera jadinii (strain ATCC 18201 / CBS 1600 / BCRC 20928 / JCM 3617 / NBRC 0987 / NRRL Y-1542) TaxID=983966 RepID=A0A1E4S0R0_CYBJN|nr:S-adenosyl-L-methionine dependent methyltransferase [Cyberlindnera jadinii NRRL Y-1542]ODV73076.1 S-adenosyl-L-methionine dependent methyltransferase [Cyberlindnera jadinii NRRL Y-1542]
MNRVFSVDYNELVGKYPDELGRYWHGGVYEYSYGGQCALTKVLLKEYFDLSVAILDGHLVPSVPSRVVYLRIVKRILDESLTLKRHVHGLDVGTGAYAIYAILANRLFGWQMTGIDVDPQSIRHAQGIVEANKLSGVEVAEGDGVVGSEYDFMVCNPPFYDKSGVSVQKGGLRRDSVVGTTAELVYEDGGEVGFVKRLIDQSVQRQAVWFSSLIGLKSSVSHLIHHLLTKNTDNFNVQEYHLGKTKRWILFWSFGHFRPQIVHSVFNNVKTTVFEGSFDLERVQALLTDSHIEELTS